MLWRVFYFLQRNQPEIGSLITKLESMTDPFDLDLLNAQNRRHVQKQMQKQLTLWGILISPETYAQLIRSHGGAKIVSATHEQSQLMPIIGGIKRFQLLPISAPSEDSENKNFAAISHRRPISGSSSVMPLSSAATGAVAAGNLRPSATSASLTSQLFAKSSSFYDKISSSWFGM